MVFIVTGIADFEDEEVSDEDFGSEDAEGITQSDGGEPSSPEPTNLGSGTPEVSERGGGSVQTSINNLNECKINLSNFEKKNKVKLEEIATLENKINSLRTNIESLEVKIKNEKSLFIEGVIRDRKKELKNKETELNNTNISTEHTKLKSNYEKLHNELSNKVVIFERQNNEDLKIISKKQGVDLEQLKILNTELLYKNCKLYRNIDFIVLPSVMYTRSEPVEKELQ